MNKYIFDKKLYARRIKVARKRKNLTQEQLSDILNMNPNTIDLNIDYLFLSEEFEASQEENIATLDELISKLTDKERNIIMICIKALINNRAT